MLRPHAENLGFHPLTKVYRPRYMDQCRELMALKIETDRNFLTAIVSEGDGVSLWKKSRLAINLRTALPV